jgi:urease accessory protein
MKRRTWFVALGVSLVLSLLLSSSAGAHHEGTLAGAGGFAAGFAHPWLGLDHLLAMVAVGLLGVSLRGRALWALPASFLGMMLVGGAIGMAGPKPPLVETGVALSVVALGIALASGRKYPLTASAACVGAFGLAHGHAHGTEMPALVAPVFYAGGFLLATALLHAAGIAGGLTLAAGNRGETVRRLSGAAISCAGMWLLVGAI